jgi:hypothetical protein
MVSKQRKLEDEITSIVVEEESDGEIQSEFSEVEDVWDRGLMTGTVECTRDKVTSLQHLEKCLIYHSLH